MSNYLYNGVELPPLPECSYRYVFLCYNGASENYQAWFITQTSIVTREGFGITGLVQVPEGSTGVVYNLQDDNTWDEAEAWTNSSPIDMLCSNPVWTNYDMMYDDGTLYLAASYPINAETGEEIKDYVPIPITAPALDPLSMWMGWKAGNWVARQRGQKKTPVAYLYNGVRLPGLPNHSEYPYVMLDWQGEGYTKRLWVNSEPIHKGSLFWSIPAGSSGILYGLNEANEWEQGDYWNADKDPFGVPMTPYWANYDVLNKDGTVYLAASEPVPVYE